MKNKNRYRSIKKALENEICIDSSLIKRLKLKSRWCSHFKVARFRNKIPYLLSLFTIPLIPVYFICQIFISLKKETQKTYLSVDKVFLSFTRSPKIKKIHDEYASHIPFVQCVSDRTLHFINTLSFGDIFKAYFLALYYSFIFIINAHPRYYLHIMSVFELVAFDLYLEKLKVSGVGEVILTNHYDRWVTLICEKNNLSVNVIQHGLVDNSYYPKHKLSNVITVRGFNDEQINIFKTNILAGVDIRRFYLKTSIPINLNDRCEILIISNPFYLNEELIVYKKLKNKNVNVKFRPHPLYINNDVLAAIEPEDLCLEERFPSPDLCVCNGSTLGSEYNIMGYKSLSWIDSIDYNNILIILNR